eukprot:2337123-Amphidinium_carterae.1
MHIADAECATTQDAARNLQPRMPYCHAHVRTAGRPTRRVCRHPGCSAQPATSDAKWPKHCKEHSKSVHYSDLITDEVREHMLSR